MDGDNAIGAVALALDSIAGRIVAGHTELLNTYVLTNAGTELVGTRYDAVLTEPEVWLIFGQFDFSIGTISAGNSAIGAILVDGVGRPGQVAGDMNSTGRGGGTLLQVVALPPGAHYAYLRAHKSTTAGAANANAQNCRMTVLRIPTPTAPAAARPGDEQLPELTPHAPDSEPAI